MDVPARTKHQALAPDAYDLSEDGFATAAKAGIDSELLDSCESCAPRKINHYTSAYSITSIAGRKASACMTN